jgi:SAM-dependent methyltransferase
MTPAHGSLGRDSFRGPIEGVTFDTSLPTRNEEYGLLARVFRAEQPCFVVDAGTGYIPEWHVAPYILRNLGHPVLAIDNEPAHMHMPSDPAINRVLGDMTDIPAADGTVDAVVCISVLEHCSADVRAAFAAEAHRILRSDGLLFITADDFDPDSWSALLPGFDCGLRRDIGGEPLVPTVSYVLARKNG